MNIMKTPLLLVAGALLLAACATTSPVRTLYDDEADFSNYRSYGFVERAGTDEGDYTSLLTRYLQAEVSRALELRGYEPSDDPDLLVNFFVRTREQVRITERPSLSLYYGYRRGWYGVWGAYPMDRDITQYTVGTLHIDLVDAGRDQLVWEGILEGRAAQRLLDDPRTGAERAVRRIFEAFPHTALERDRPAGVEAG
ncbi:MAG: DUF4136 domain-containing protein [Gammaproteobacteria bacterium]|nr:DUF4136 domain-containing protein [Gammaproteobacteria bacterium]